MLIDGSIFSILYQQYIMSQKSTLLEKEQTYKSFTQITLIVFNISLSSFYFGYSVIYFAAVPYQTISEIYGIELDVALAQGLLNGAIGIGALFGSFLSSFLLNKFTRRQCLIIANIFSIIFGGLIYIPHFYTFITFRFMQGLCVGIFSSLSPLIIKEISPLEISGMMGNFSQFNLTGGVLFCQILSYVLKKATGDTSGESFWYIIFGFSLITQFIQLIILTFVFPYETPVYLLKAKKREECRTLLELLYKEEYVDQVLQQRQMDISHNQSIMSSQSDATKSPHLAFIITALLTVLQQFSGAFAMTLYGGQIAEIQFSGQIVLLVPVLINVIVFTFICFSFVLLKHFGRKTIIVVGFTICALSCISAGIGFHLAGKDGSSVLILTGLFVFMASYGASVGPIVWLYIPEVVSPALVAVITTFNWIANSTVAIVFPIAVQALGDDPTLMFYIFGGCCIAGTLINSKFMVETKDKTEKEIRDEYKSMKIC